MGHEFLERPLQLKLQASSLLGKVDMQMGAVGIWLVDVGSDVGRTGFFELKVDLGGIGKFEAVGELVFVAVKTESAMDQMLRDWGGYGGAKMFRVRGGDTGAIEELRLRRWASFEAAAQ